MSVPTNALVVGAGGQDGTYLSASLARRDVAVHGITRAGLIGPDGNRRALDIADAASLRSALRDIRPDAVYYLAAYHGSSESRFEAGDDALAKCMAVNVAPLLTVLEAARHDLPATRIFYAGSSRIFGEPAQAPQTEATPWAPNTPYGISKALGMQACALYRNGHGVFASCGILYNHESPLRGERYVTRRIARQAVAAKRGEIASIRVGSLDARVDWGWAPDYVEAFQAILGLDTAGDFVIATGRLNTVRRFLELALERVGLPADFPVESDPSVAAGVNDSHDLVGDCAKLRAATGWQPDHGIEEIVARMVDAEMAV